MELLLILKTWIMLRRIVDTYQTTHFQLHKSIVLLAQNSLLIITTMSDSQDCLRHGRQPRPFESRQNREVETRSSYLKNFHEKGRQEKQQIQMIFKDSDNSIQNILNNSMGHIDKVIQGFEPHSENLSYKDVVRQNALLRDSLTKMKRILKQKLEAGLTKQREELSEVLGNYITLITKLLQDKQQLTATIKQIESYKPKLRQYSIEIQNLKEINQERNNQIKIDKQKLDQFLTIIEGYKQDQQKQSEQMQAMVRKCDELQSKGVSRIMKSKDHIVSSSFPEKRQAHQAKIQTLIQLLQNTQDENKILNEQIRSLRRTIQELRESHEEQIKIMNEQNQDQFLQYEKAVKRTLDNKDESIERLNAVIQNLKRK